MSEVGREGGTDGGSSHRAILALALPAMGALAADPLLGLVDTALVGRLGAVPLAALGVNVAVFATVFWGFNFLTYGTTAAVARRRGAGDAEGAARYAVQALWLAVGLGAAVSLVLLVAAPAVVAAMGARGDVVEPALAYLRIRALAAVPVLIVAVGHGGFRGLADTRTPLAITVTANAANAAISYVLIYPVGLGVAGAAWGTLLAQTGAAVAFLVLGSRAFPVPDRGLADTRTPLAITVTANAANAAISYVLIYPVGLGVAGAAWGTLLAQTGAAVAFLVLGSRAFPVPDRGLDPSGMRDLLRVSRDLFLRTATLLAALLVTTAVAARMGVATVAGHQIARELWTMMTLVLDGFAIAGQTLVATALGAGRPERARAETRRLLGWGLVTGSVIGLGYLSLAGPLPRLFTTDAAVLQQVGSVWLVIALLQPVGGIVFVLDGVLMGAGDYRFLLWSTAGAALLCLTPIALASLWLGWGLQGVWAGMVALMLVRLATTLWRLRQGGWVAAVA